MYDKGCNVVAGCCSGAGLVAAGTCSSGQLLRRQPIIANQEEPPYILPDTRPCRLDGVNVHQAGGGDVPYIYTFHATFTQKGYFVSAIVQKTM